MLRCMGNEMKNWMLAALMGVTLSGCVAPQMAPKESALRSVRTVSVVPIESPPLFLHPKTAEDKAAVTAFKNVLNLSLV